MVIIKPGLLTSIQDLGRKGFQKHGVIVSGAMDPYSLRIANLLIGNMEEEAVMEITLMGPTLKLEKDCLIAITGGDLSPEINGIPVPMWRPVYIKKGAILEFGECRSGCRSYLSVAGGFTIPSVMNSKSTYLRGGIGGYKGRALQVSDIVKFNAESNKIDKCEVNSAFTTVNWFVNEKNFMPESKPVIRFTKGRQADNFTESSKIQFEKERFKVSNQSDRMGYRISGPTIEFKEKRELLSEAVMNGSIQVPPDGNPIILLSDSQTTGGYPKIAQVITADIPFIAQVKPGEFIRFSKVNLREAEQLYLQKEQNIKQLKTSISATLNKVLVK